MLKIWKSGLTGVQLVKNKFPRKWESNQLISIMRNYFIYILASKKNGTLYIGFTNNLKRRISEHKNKVLDGFTKKYNVRLLVYYEKHIAEQAAMKREKQIKKWERQWKLELIEKNNPNRKDLSNESSSFENLKILYG